jgi:hypothetical protein
LPGTRVANADLDVFRIPPSHLPINTNWKLWAPQQRFLQFDFNSAPKMLTNPISCAGTILASVDLFEGCILLFKPSHFHQW